MLRGILSRHALAPRQLAMVGDRLYTDMAMAHRAGALGVLVLTGETTAAQGANHSPAPDLVVSGLAELGERLRAARHEERFAGERASAHRWRTPAGAAEHAHEAATAVFWQDEASLDVLVIGGGIVGVGRGAGCGDARAAGRAGRAARLCLRHEQPFEPAAAWRAALPGARPRRAGPRGERREEGDSPHRAAPGGAAAVHLSRPIAATGTGCCGN